MTPDNLFKFLIKAATDAETMELLLSDDDADVEQAFEGANLSQEQKDAIIAGNPIGVRDGLGVPSGFVFNQSGESAAPPAPDRE